MLSDIFDTIKNNQMLMTLFGLSGAGIITFWIKDVPRSIFHYLRRELTTELIVTSHNKSFHEILRWLEKEFKTKNFRRLKLSNGKWGYEDTTTSIGYGYHWVKYKNTFLLINLTKEAANQSSSDKETLTIMKLGRSRKLFDRFVKEVESIDLDLTQTKLYKMDESWIYVRDQQKRDMGSIFIEKEKKSLLINSISQFINNEAWYIKNGIPYQLGILLYGAPGTGKTSLIKAIAGYLNYPIYYLSPHKLNRIEVAMSTLPDKCLVVIEDIDSNYLTHSREDKSDLSGEGEILSKFSTTSLSEILNALDGMFSAHGRILIATTNHIEKLDNALIRPGRIDIKVEVGYVNKEIFVEFMNNFFPDNTIDFDTITIQPNITVAMLQNMVLQKYNEYQIINCIKGEFS